MKTILVMDVPAEEGGALTILRQYYDKALEDKNKKWVFITSTPHLKETEHIKNLRFPWVKKSWFHRLYFDNLIAPQLIKRLKIDEVLSLQNVIVPRTKKPQTLYLHQSLPFIPKRFSFKENKLLWIYQNIISRIIFKSIQKADKIIVQTNWMKKAVLEKVNVEERKIIVSPPKMDVVVKKKFNDSAENYKTFFYPASGFEYKNHRVIINALLELKECNKNYEIIFTLKGDENAEIADLHKISVENDLPIKFIGSLKYEEVLEYYSKSVLIFSSYIETFGLPLLEAKMHNTPIIAADMPFSQEILHDYNRAVFFEYQDYSALAKYIIEFSSKK